MHNMIKLNKNKVILATGGTAGHIFPAIATAEELVELGIEPVFIVDKRYYNYQYEQQYKAHVIYSGHLQSTIIGKMKSTINIAYGIIQAISYLLHHRPFLVVGFGGYPSLPTLVAAKILGIPIILHEQNSILGKVQKLFARHAKCIAISFKDTKGIARNLSHKIIYTGNPVRKSIIKTLNSEYKLGHNFNLVIIGGSQGAAIFADIITDAISKLPVELRSKINITQQCRKEQLDSLKARYSSIDNLGSVRIVDFILDIAQTLSEAHLVICRSGATTLAELKVAKRPALFIPLPSAADNHQLYNAQLFVADYGGWLIEQQDFTTNNMTKFLTSLISNPQLLYDCYNNIRAKSTEHRNVSLAQLILQEAI
jgi:UDP-N-acetylglucosamine--N-acetylmuramyl-(pentapeptide) pyrophosphoryl-undecaprenol N-acetylglucosamine transferase